MADELTLTIDGTEYSGWESVAITTGILFGASKFQVTVSERWAQQPTPWQIKLFQAADLYIDGAPVLAGFVEGYSPSIAKNAHPVRISGRSKACDFIDCMPDLASNFNDQTLDQIAKAAAAPFGLTPLIQCPMGDPFPPAVLDKTETAHSFIERLARMRSVLVTDDDKTGNPVLTQAGLGGAAGVDLIEGVNILYADAELNCQDRYKTYVVLAQTPEAYDDGEATPVVDVQGSATDSGVPWARRFAEHAEEAANETVASARAKWRMLHNFGMGTGATIGVQGWHKLPGGDLWKKNQTVYVKSPSLEIDRQLLIGEVRFLKDDTQGTRTELVVRPPEAFTPGQQNVMNSGNSIWNFN